MPNPAIHNGAYTIISPKDGSHRTFEIKTVRGNKERPADAFCNKFAGHRTVGLLTGPDNTASYTRFGWVDPEGIVVFTKNTGSLVAMTDWDKYATLLWSLATEGERSPYYVMGYRIRVEKRCLICNRRLTHPESLETGIGPDCATRM